ncbi:nicotinamide N-methyltransferase-like [Hyla sarda]|uniref:nicotinamide N-methyltransferase-like n=1 Tax=Hyla sarda TaxID=327740 RepID=UPI0024C354A0|nr:nicotinamide N-methyltransferase-like [Hyla sarda]
MTSTNYEISDGYDSNKSPEHYFTCMNTMIFEEDALLFPIENLTKTLKEGRISGDVIINLSVASVVHHLYAACDFFKHLIVLEVNDRCTIKLKRWLDSRTGVIGDQLSDREGKVRSSLQNIVKCDPEKENMTDPIVLPPADCIFSAWLLEEISKDQHGYIRYLRKFSKMLKPGGHLILIGALRMTYFFVGKNKFRSFKNYEAFIRKALAGEGFVIDKCKIKKRTTVSDLSDYKAVIFISAHKEK